MNEEILNEILLTVRAIDQKVDALTAAHNDTVDRVNNVMTEVQPHLGRVGEMLDSLQKHPMAKMLGIGGK